MPAICKAQTTKQAKASFKARGRPSLSDAEQRQLERSIELEQRAERSKEAEKRRAEATRKRAENAKRERSARERGQLLSQRRCDKFGFKASQFHLGAFFGKPGNEAVVGQVRQADQEEDVFGDEDLDDEELFKALESANPRKSQPDTKQAPKSDAVLMPPPPRPQPVALNRSHTEPTPAVDHDLGSFWDDLESSTQIARELNSDSPKREKHLESKAGSFSSEDFDLTAEDLDELDPPKTGMMPTVESVRQTMPPSKSPLKTAVKTMPPSKLPVKTAVRTMPPPPVVAAKRVQNKAKPQNAIRGPFLPASSLYCSPELGFTLTQLENFVEDDLQLTQAVPG
ncbi:hypothetical protein PRZ48_005472 [Zasmidium cellare]|uniref:Uncharacterized protein n=1 Tax=Zasmidium cellare TaxID=395010 RepID=A0ABR0ESH3_ZASCE|nr:hypothetical protein PRZ48_005472 [Zasmidium cellare]